MNGLGWILTIVVGILAGWIAEKVMKRDHGLIMNLIVGVIGALIGGSLASLLGITFAGFLGNLIVATIGAILLLWVVGIVRRKA